MYTVGTYILSVHQTGFVSHKVPSTRTEESSLFKIKLTFKTGNMSAYKFINMLSVRMIRQLWLQKRFTTVVKVFFNFIDAYVTSYK